MMCRRSIFDIHTDVSSNTGVPHAEHTKEMTVPEFKYIMIQSKENVKYKYLSSKSGAIYYMTI